MGRGGDLGGGAALAAAVAVKAGRVQARQIVGPQGLLLAAQLVQVIPREQTGVVAVRERGLDRVVADRLYAGDADCALAELIPTVPEHEVQAHTHDDAHFLLLLGGTYLSSASGMPAECSVPTLILNPPGTEHRDRFRGCEGRFLTLSIPAAAWSVASNFRELPRQALKLSMSGMVRAMRLRWELSNWNDASPLVVEDGIETLLDECTIVHSVRMKSVPAWLERARQRLHDDAREPRYIKTLRSEGYVFSATVEVREERR